MAFPFPTVFILLFSIEIMGVCSSKTVKSSVLDSVSIHRKPVEEEWSLVVTSKRTAVPQLQPVHSNPLHARRKITFQSASNALRSSSALDTFCVSAQLDSCTGDLEKPQEATAT